MMQVEKIHELIRSATLVHIKLLDGTFVTGKIKRLIDDHLAIVETKRLIFFRSEFAIPVFEIEFIAHRPKDRGELCLLKFRTS